MGRPSMPSQHSHLSSKKHCLHSGTLSSPDLVHGMQSYASATAANVKDNDQGAQPAQLDAPSAGGTGGQPSNHCSLIEQSSCLLLLI